MSNGGQPPLQGIHVRWLLAALALAFLPHLAHLPPVIGAACLLAGVWRWQAARQLWRLPGKTLRLLLTLAAMGTVYLTFGTVLGRDAGTALLALMLALKLLEMQRQRDAAIVIALAYFFTVTLALYSQAAPLLAYQFLVLLMITASLLQLNRPNNPAATGQALRQAGKLLLQALPVMLVLFLLFPRLPGPLWGSPQGGGGSGLDDNMTPGSISHLGLSDAVAFRVEFNGPIPDNRQLYWRGPVLWYSDGRSWHAEEPGRRPAASLVELMLAGDPLRYHVTLEPHGRRWLYALDLPTTIPPGSQRSSDLLLLANHPVNRVTRYTVSSHLHYRTGPLTAGQRRRALQQPPGINPRTRALGRQWAAAAPDQWAVVQEALRYFREQPFHYTLEPPLLEQPDPMDQFLFETRRGFCEHYAAAFTVLMRAAGIPSRIVTGYQGGELNPVGKYLIVRQRDAHAWAEVWLAGRGWVRIDPTAAVAPERIEKGIDSVLEPEFRQGFEKGALAPLWQRLRYGMDALNNGWNQWVLGYGPQLQQQLLSRWGMDSWAAKALGMIVTLAVVIAALALYLLYRQQGRRDPVAHAYRRFCRKLARRGLGRRHSEGPQDFADRIMRERPDLAPEVSLISRLYIALRYGSGGENSQLVELRRQIRRFSP